MSYIGEHLLTGFSVSAAAKYKILNTDEQFVFDFSVPQNGPGNGGELIAANRVTFPALLTGSGVGGLSLGAALGRVNRTLS